MILSHCGVASVQEAVRLAAPPLSGLAGGVVAAVMLSREGVARDLIAFDMGGTSADIALVHAGEPTPSGGKTVANARIALPSLEIVTVVAGGGSIGKLDRSGLLAVGPESAEADPGPACCGQGGTDTTVADANLVLGYLDPGNSLGGRQVLDLDSAQAALGRVAASLGLGVAEAAAGIHRLVKTRMADGRGSRPCGAGSIGAAMRCWRSVVRPGCMSARWRPNLGSVGWWCRSPHRCSRPEECSAPICGSS